MSAEKARAESLETWESVAPGWERRRDFVFESSRSVSEWLVERLDPRAGETILELAAGPGDTGFLVAKQIAPSGKLISTDFSPSMIEVAKKRAREREVTNADFRVMDAEKMDQESSSVDGVICRFGFMLMVDQKAAFGETRRVLREGGRVAFAVWGPPVENPWLVLPGMALMNLGLMELPDPDEPGGVFSLADEERIQSMLSEAGFADVLIEKIPVQFPYRDIDEGLEIMADVGGPMAKVLREQDDQVVKQIKEASTEVFESYKTEKGYSLPGQAIAVFAKT